MRRRSLAEKHVLLSIPQSTEIRTADFVNLVYEEDEITNMVPGV